MASEPASGSERQNAPIDSPVESFFSSLKAELVSTADWPTHDDAAAAVADYLRFYNHQRLHSALDYQSPAQYEAALEAAV